MSLEEKFEALMKSYQTIANSNQKLTQIPSRSIQGEGSEVEGQLRELSSEEEIPRCLKR